MRDPLRVRLVLMLALLWGWAGVSMAQDATPAPRNVTAFPPGAVVFGLTAGEWSARYAQWSLSFPVGVSPGQDVTGERCGYGQSGPVFFIPRNLSPCVVPVGVAVFVSIAGTSCSTVEPVPYFGRDEPELRACAATEAERYTGIAVSLDGQDIPDIASYRAASPLFTMRLPENNVLGVPAGFMEAVADGYQVILAPLPAGDHEVVVHLELTDGTILPDKILRISVVGPATTDGDATPAAGPPGATPIA